MAKNYTYIKGAEYPYQYKYEHMAVTTDCVIFTYENRTLKVLLVRRGTDPFKGKWAFPGGFLKLDETAKDGALRELVRKPLWRHLQFSTMWSKTPTGQRQTCIRWDSRRKLLMLSAFWLIVINMNLTRNISTESSNQAIIWPSSAKWMTSSITSQEERPAIMSDLFRSTKQRLGSLSILCFNEKM